MPSYRNSCPAVCNLLFTFLGLMTLSGNVESREEILEPSKFTFDIKRVLTGVKSLDVAGNLDNVNVSLGQRDLALILDIYYSNRTTPTIIGKYQHTPGALLCVMIS